MDDAFDERTLRILRHARDVMGSSRQVTRTFGSRPCDYPPAVPAEIGKPLDDDESTAEAR
jgi:hypothetical protein